MYIVYYYSKISNTNRYLRQISADHMIYTYDCNMAHRFKAKILFYFFMRKAFNWKHSNIKRWLRATNQYIIRCNK